MDMPNTQVFSSISNSSGSGGVKSSFRSLHSIVSQSLNDINDPPGDVPHGVLLPSPCLPARPSRPPSERQVGRLKVMQNYLDRQYRVARYVLELSPIQYDQTRLLITKKLLKGRALKFEALGTLVTAMKAHLLFL